MGSWGVCVGRCNVCSLVGLETKRHMEKAGVVYRDLFLSYSDFHIYKTLLKTVSGVSSPVPKIK